MAGFLKNTTVNFISRAAGQATNALALILIARSLGPAMQGEFTGALLLPSMLSAFLAFGFNNSTVRLVCQRRFPEEVAFAQNVLFASATSLLAMAAGAAVIYGWGGELFPGNRSESLFIALAVLPSIIFINLLSHFLLSINRMTEFSVSGVLSTFFFLLLLLAARFSGGLTVDAVLWINCLAGTLAAAFTVRWCLPHVRNVVFWPDPRYQLAALKFGFVVYVASLIAILDGAVGLFIINLFLSSAQLGEYSVAVRLAEGIWIISITMSTVLFPRSASSRDEKDAVRFSCLVCRASFLLTLLAGGALWVLAPYFIPFLFSESYLPAVLPFRILLAGTLAISVWRVLANDLIGRGDPMPVTVIAAISLLVNVVGGCLLIRVYGLTGMAVSTALVYWIRVVLTAFVYRRKTGIAYSDIWLPKKGDLEMYWSKITKAWIALPAGGR